MFEVVRSPARVTWILKFNGTVLEYCQTKSLALLKLEEYKKYI